jgi:hypothetical protein
MCRGIWDFIAEKADEQQRAKEAANLEKRMEKLILRITEEAARREDKIAHEAFVREEKIAHEAFEREEKIAHEAFEREEKIAREAFEKEMKVWDRLFEHKRKTSLLLLCALIILEDMNEIRNLFDRIPRENLRIIASMMYEEHIVEKIEQLLEKFPNLNSNSFVFCMIMLIIDSMNPGADHGENK